MSSIKKYTDFSRTAVDKISIGEPQWLRSVRFEAFDHFDQLSFPKTSQELWRRTDIRTFKLDRFKPHGDSDENSLLSSDGRIYFARLKVATDERPELVEKYLGQLCGENNNKFEALQRAFRNNGYLLHVPKGVSVKTPLKFSVELSENGSLDLSHSLVVAEADSEITIVEEIRSQNGSIGMHCGAVEIFVDRNARVNYFQIQELNQESWNFSTQRAKVENDANLNWVTVQLGGRLSRIDQRVTLTGTGSHADLLGLTFAEKRQHIDLQTCQKHIAPHTTSNLLYQNVLKNRSRTVWRGMIDVQPMAQKTDAYQKNNNLVLSEKARADTIPGLEILADDVRCTHGATAGTTNEDQIFYLMSRGMPRHRAEQLIVEGFFEPIMSKIPMDSVREKLQKSIGKKLSS